MKKVAILGCGPSGLLAAHAAQINQCDFRIFSRLRPSKLYGAQYLHEPISGITDEPREVRYSLVGGTPEQYRKKVYGDTWDGSVSPEDISQNHMAWDIRQAYSELWRRYGAYIEHMEFYHESQIISDARLERYDIIISTVPRKIWARPGDRFSSVKVWAYGDAPDRGQFVPFRPGENFTVLCDGSSDVGWYRLSRVFDHSTVEYPFANKPPLNGVQVVEKPIDHNSTAAPDFVHIGRYGAWKKGVLTTDAFHEALKVTM